MAGDPHFETRALENTLVAFWIGEPTVARLEAMVEELCELWSKHPSGVFLLNVITEKTGIPDNEARRAIVQQFDSMRNRLKASAIVLEKTGVDGTMSRTILSTLVTISRRPFAMKVFSNRGEAATWLAEQSGANASALTNLIGQLERRFALRVGANTPVRSSQESRFSNIK